MAEEDKGKVALTITLLLIFWVCTAITLVP